MKKWPKLKKFDIVFVKWEDIVGSGGEWCHIDHDDTEPQLCYNIGFIYAGMNKNSKTLKVCACISEGVISHRDAIPKGCIKDVIILKRLDKKLNSWVDCEE